MALGGGCANVAVGRSRNASGLRRGPAGRLLLEVVRRGRGRPLALAVPRIADGRSGAWGLR